MRATEKFQKKAPLVCVRSLLLCAASLLCIGATEFPEFDTGDFEEAIDERDYFEPESKTSFDIPAVSERFYGTDIPRLPIISIQMDEVRAFPALGITQESVQALVNAEFERQQGIELDENGFTDRNQKDIGRFLRELIDRGGRPDQRDMNDLMGLMRQVETQASWITVEQLDAIAQAVTSFYRQKGLILATAYIPEQQVANGVVHLKVLEGRLGEVTVSGNASYHEDFIKSPFINDLGDPVTDRGIEGSLRRINDSPGLRVRGSFSPGNKIGETSLNINVLEEKTWALALSVDDHGSPITGEKRTYLSGEWLNAFRKGHRLSFGLLDTRKDSTYGLLGYEFPLTRDQRGKLGIQWSTNHFSIESINTSGGGSLPDIDGETESYSVLGSYQHVRGRTHNIKSELSYVYKDVLLDLNTRKAGGGITDPDVYQERLAADRQTDVLRLVRYMVDINQLWDEQQLLITGRAGIEQGHFVKGQEVPGQDGTGRDQGRAFTKALLNANVLKRVSLYNPVTKRESAFNLLVKLNVQYAERFLAPVEKFSLGGPSAVRSFTVSDLSVDSGAYLGAEIYFDLPFDPFGGLNLPYDVIKPYVFYDYGYGVVRDADLPSSPGADLDVVVEAYGLGMRLNFGDRLSGNLVFARPKSVWSQDGFFEPERADQVFFDLTYNVH